MEDWHFEPLYPLSHYVLKLLAALPGIAGLAVGTGLGLGRHVLLASALLALLLPALLGLRHVRRIDFGEQLIVIRFLFHDRYCNYQQLIRVDDTRLWTQHLRVYIGNWLNRSAFYERIRVLKEQGRLRHVALSGTAPGGPDNTQALKGA